ncbi:iron(III) transport system permease protein [Paracoccus alcaliphilus]|uniref:Iron(III) transport system permease protein n=1 Tax=Paracoccus alcaliphilus TaxID=34002 RepID=A0A1H8JBA5_9RHOB|nr:iron ABC transporter permease [Paracoccus alcaliphilus]SEN77616.1 iron(III) transport system permease protein [Paracoccus alcaliphilus]
MLVIPALLVGLGTCLPVFYLILRALDAEPTQLAEIVFRSRNLLLLGNTLKLVAVVLTIATVIALPLAWLLTRSDLRHKRALSFLMVVPLAVPGYVMAYALIGLSGYYGFLRHWFGFSTPPLRGLWGAGLALALYTFPYIFLNLRAAFLGMDPAQEETARSLGKSRWSVFRHVTLPQLWPALVASWLIVGLYVIGDFGAIALMRYEVFSYAIYTQYSGAFDRTYAAWLSLMLLALTVAALMGQRAVTRNRRHARTGTGSARAARPVVLGRWRWLARAGIALVALVSIGLPLMVLAHWMRFGAGGVDLSGVARAAISTALIAAPVAVIAAALALPVVLLTVRHHGPFPAAIDRLAHLGYATPSLAFALAMVFFSLQAAPFLYQSHALLIFAYVTSFLALALGPIRLALLQIGTRTEDAARTLGTPPARAFARVVLPRLRRPMVAGGILVFIMVVKELPLALILAPTGFRSLSMNVFSRTVEGMMAEAAPHALAIILFSSLVIGLILKYEGGQHRPERMA